MQVPASPATLLRRPAGPGRRPAIAAPDPAARGALPSFLRATSGGTQGGHWFESGAPVDITGFDPREDVLSVRFAAGTSLPKLSIRPGQDRAATEVLADGKPIAILHRAGAGFSLRNVAVTRACA